MEMYLCIHGHFYQPPRENPWLEAIEVQDSARPYHDWNERITAECYASNAASRRVDSKNRIIDIVNNYEKMSFDFGPILLSWIEKNRPEAYAKVLEADRATLGQRRGHGNALAQVYNHIIMPLASRRDKVTQVIWGIRDFEYRFGRRPEGMWLSETAVDAETLGVMAEQGIKFTILAPHQVSKVRPLTEGEWKDVRGGRIDPRRPYRFFLPDGKSIGLFFYNGPISRAIAFEGLLRSGEELVNRLIKGFSDEQNGPQLVHVATDGESYGHHFPFGDMALAHAFYQAETDGLAHLTNYGEFLEIEPPKYQAEIIENSSWSCSHGIERWRSDCGCNSGGHPGWNQSWRKPLRESLDWLKERLDEVFEEKAGKFLKDPWGARDDYIQVILDRSPENVDSFLSRHQLRTLDHFEKVNVLKLMEMERHGLLMFTSCGWFFDELSGLETIQVLRYAAMAIQVCRSFTRLDLEGEFLKRLSDAKSNVPELGDGKEVYLRFVQPSVVDLRRVIAHYAISSLFEDYGEETKVYCFTIKRLDYERESYGNTSLAVRRVRVSSEITKEVEDASFGLLHFGGHDFHCAIRGFLDLPGMETAKRDLFEKFSKHTLTEVVRALDQHFESRYYTLKDLFIEERRKILSLVMAETLGRFEEPYRRLYEENRKLMGYLKEVEAPLPEALVIAAKYVLKEELEYEMEKLLDQRELSERLFQITREAQALQLPLDMSDAEPPLRISIERRMREFLEAPDREKAEGVLDLLEVAERLSIRLNLWESQNLYHQFLRASLQNSEREIKIPKEDLEVFLRLGKRLSFSL